MTERLTRFISTTDKFLRESHPGFVPQYTEFHTFVGGLCGSGKNATTVRFYRAGYWEIVQGSLIAQANSFLECLEQLHN
jgi:hypothetical protein